MTTDTNPIDSTPTHVRPLLDTLTRTGHRRIFAITLIGAVAQYAGAVVAAAAGGWVVGAAIDGSSVRELVPGGIALLLGFAAAVIGQWVNIQWAHAFAWRHQATLRLDIFDGLERSTPRKVLGQRTGEIASVTMADIEALEQFFAHLAPTGVAAAVVAVGAAAALLTVSPLIALVFACGAVAVGVVPSILSRRATTRGEQLRAALSQLNADVIDGVRGTRELLLMRQTTSWSDRISARTSTYAASQRRQARAQGSQQSVTDLLMSVTLVITLVVAVSAGARGSLSLPAATLAIMLVIGALRPVAEAVAIAGALAPLRGSARRVLTLIEQPEVVPDAATSSPRPADHSVTFDRVSFEYEADRPVLSDATFGAASGEMIAIVGASGAGKSTCASLLLRFWDVGAGSIRIGGHDLRDYPVDDLRHLVSVVPQEVHLFDGTVADNLRIGAPDATDEQVTAAARTANAHAFIEQLPEGYATPVGENGARLSGGQRQRLAIARALLHDTPILVLDEAASNLDTENEQAIHAALRAARQDKTTIVIAHRLSTIRSADRIVVLDGGRVIETGTHDELTEAAGTFATLAASTP